MSECVVDLRCPHSPSIVQREKKKNHPHPFTFFFFFFFTVVSQSPEYLYANLSHYMYIANIKCDKESAGLNEVVKDSA